MKRFVFLLLSAGAIFLFAACGESDEPKSLPDGLYAKIVTNQGEILCRLEYQKAPMTVANFVGLAEGEIPNTHKGEGEPYFDGLTFHRVVPNFVIQGGDPLANGLGGPGYYFNNETHPELPHNVAGTLSMANAGPNTNGSQFFITHRATPELDNGYSVFGYVVDGMVTVFKIKQGDTIQSVKIIRKGSEAENFDAPSVFTEKSGVTGPNQ